MKPRRIAWAGALLCLAALVFVTAARLGGLGHDVRSAEITVGPLAAWNVYPARIESRTVRSISSPVDGPAVITSLAPEGIPIKTGTLLATFDGSEIERIVWRLERDVALAQSEWNSLVKATHPLKTRSLRIDLMEAQTTLEEEEQYLKDSRELAEDGLVSPVEIRQQEQRIARARMRWESVETELDLTTNILHRAEVARAEARLDAAGQELEAARNQLKGCTVRSPAAGQVVYMPLHIAGEYRSVRVGDTIHKNQPFMSIPGMDEPVARCFIPESELAGVRVDSDATLVPLAYPQLRLPGVVESVGSIARTRVGEPHWKKFFEVTIRMEESDSPVRFGMTAECRILRHRNERALRIPRAAVWWDGDSPYCGVVEGRRARITPILLGAADPEFIEVLEGLRESDRVKMP
jgi:multidrug resistance efflux pump